MSRARSAEPTVVLAALRVPVSTQARLLELSVQWGVPMAEAHRRALAEGMYPPKLPPRANPVEARATVAETRSKPVGQRPPCTCPRPKPQGPSVKYGVCPECKGRR